MPEGATELETYRILFSKGAAISSKHQPCSNVVTDGEYVAFHDIVSGMIAEAQAQVVADAEKAVDSYKEARDQAAAEVTTLKSKHEAALALFNARQGSWHCRMVRMMCFEREMRDQVC